MLIHLERGAATRVVHSKECACTVSQSIYPIKYYNFLEFYIQTISRDRWHTILSHSTIQVSKRDKTGINMSHITYIHLSYIRISPWFIKLTSDLEDPGSSGSICINHEGKLEAPDVLVRQRRQRWTPEGPPGGRWTGKMLQEQHHSGKDTEKYWKYVENYGKKKEHIWKDGKVENRY